MQRKKWTAKSEVTEALLVFREKRKWQLALRRYILDKTPCLAYAPYFGLDINGFREWIALQFTKELNWKNFAKAWQFDHIVPVTYFDFSLEEELKLCWNFINIRVEKIEMNKNRGNRIDVLAVKPYFEDLFKKTGHEYCLRMIEKLERIEISNIVSNPTIENFIINNKDHIATLSTLSKDEFARLNQGVLLKDLLFEREIIKKYGG